VNVPIPPRPDLASTSPASVRTASSGRPLATWSWWEAIGLYVVTFLIAGFAIIPIIVLMGDSERGSGLGAAGVVSTIAADLLMAALWVWWLQRRHREWREAIVLVPEPDRWWREIGAGVATGLVLVPAVGIVSLTLQGILSGLLDHDVSAPQQVSSDLSGAAAAAAVFLAVVIAPITEEFFFRGILFRALRDRRGFWIAALGSAIPWGIVHVTTSPWEENLLLQLPIACMGIVLAWLYDRRGTLTANVVAHMAFNAVGIALILSG
jgi:membrane protease YdiL (CAAX protease family)